MSEVNTIQIGKFTITYLENGKLWIMHANGEGMECEVSKLEETLDRFWEEEF